MIMQLFKDYHSKDAQATTLEQVMDIIHKDETVKRSTEQHRSLLASGQEKAAKLVKESTPQVAVAFRMEGGKGKDCCRECLYQVLIDFDAKAPGERLPEDELERVKTVMRTSNHAMLGYESISGLGYHVLVPFRLPDGISIDMQADPVRGEEIYRRVCKYVRNMYSVWTGHEMDASCDNINRMMGLSHDPLVVMRTDAYPFCPTRKELGIDDEGNLMKMRSAKQKVDKDGKRMCVPLGDRLEKAISMVEESGMTFAVGNRHNFVMRVAFILNRMGVDEEEAAQALDDAYGGQMEGRPSAVLRSCYKTAQDEFGAWMPKRSNVEIKTEVVADFLAGKPLQYDALTQKTRMQMEDGRWKDLTDRDENDLYRECCTSSGFNLSKQLFQTVLCSGAVPEVNPLREWMNSLPEWDGNTDYIGQAAAMVHMASEEEQTLWGRVFPKWLTALVAGWMYDDVVNHQVIVFVGAQGIYKSTWLNRLMPPALRAYATDNIDIERLDKDEQLRAAEYGLINIDELDKLTDRQLNRIKSMITTTQVDVRAAYGHHKEKRIRVASYVASGNKEEFLTDQTGNRRWLPFHVLSIDSPFTHQMPHEGMFAQALHLLRTGFDYWFSLDDIRSMGEHVEQFMVPTSEEELIRVYFSPAKADQPGAMFLTLAEIAAKLTLHGNLRREPDPRHLGAIMSKLGYTKATKGHNKTRGYILIEHTEREVDKIHDPNAQ